MKVSYNWLKDYVKIDYSPEDLAEKLTGAGVEVEEILCKIPEFTGVVVGKVNDVRKHPDADKLSVCKVSDGSEEFQVICGALNVQTGQTVPFARTGAKLVGNFKIKKAKIRGIESFGMICSKEELGLEKKSEGIWALAGDGYQLGQDFHSILNRAQDYIFDLFITPNRPDCLNFIGIARELSAITRKDLNIPEIDLQESENKKAAELVSINIENPEGCPRYAARVINNVKIGPSPEWLVERLEAASIRSINNVVDITNFVLMETGHPLHAFDLNEIKGAEVNVRYSRKGEKFTTLDEKERVLPENTVIICDAERAVAIGGIMGGMNSEVTEKTQHVLLEAAYFKRENIAVSSKKLGLSTEASQRFERGADIDGVIYALDRAADLMATLASGEVAKGIIDEYPQKAPVVTVPFRTSRVNHVLGSTLGGQEIIEPLKYLGFKIADTLVTVPSYRVDVHQEIDLIEEVARMVNYDNLPTRIETKIPYDKAGGFREDLYNGMLREKMIELGFLEALTNSMISNTDTQPFSDEEPVSILNPISDDMAIMRPLLLPGLLKSVDFNLNRNISNVRLFELGRVFKYKGKGESPDQPYHIAAVMCGNRDGAKWEASAHTVDFYDIKGIVEAMFSKIFLDKIQLILYDNRKYLSPDESVGINFKNMNIGCYGRLSDQVLKQFNIEVPVYAFELSLDPLLEATKKRRQFVPIPRFPYVEKDMALVLDDSKPASEVTDYIKSIGGPLLKTVEVFDVFRGGKLPAGKKSLAIRMHFQSAERTLSDEEVDTIFKKIIKEASKAFKASLRD